MKDGLFFNIYVARSSRNEDFVDYVTFYFLAFKQGVWTLIYSIEKLFKGQDWMLWELLFY